MFSYADHWFWPGSLPTFDFSLKFEETALQILPSGSFLFFACAIVLHYCQANVCIRQSKLLWAKAIITLVLVALELANLVLRSLSSDRTDTTYSAAALDCAAALAIAVVVWIEHRHAIRTSAILGLYLAVGTLIDGTKCRSYFLRDLTASGAVSGATAVARLVLVILEEIPKTNLIIDAELRNISAGEATSGFFTRTFFLFLGPIIGLGYRAILTVDDLTDLGIEFAARCLFSSLAESWPTAGRDKKNSLFVACCKAWKWAILIIILPRLGLTGFMYSQPFVLRTVISDIDKPDQGEKGGIVGAVLFAFGGAAVCRAASRHLTNRLVTRARGGLISLIFNKSYRLRLSAAKDQAAVTLISADYESIAEGIPACIEIPFAILESVLGIYFLSHFVKLSCLIIFAPLVLTQILGVLFGKSSSAAVAHWNEQIQNRVTSTSKILSQLPAIKSLGLGPKMMEYMSNLRAIETAASAKYRLIQALSLGSAVMVDQLTPVLIVAAGLFTNMFGDRIDPEILYPTLGILTLVQGPLADLLTTYPEAMSMLGCFERIQEFLCQDEHEDPRVILRSCAGTEREKNVSSSSSEKRENPTAPAPIPIFRFEKAAIAPYGSDKAILKNVDFSINAGSITSIFGSTSSGKTTMLQGLLGDAEIIEGKVCVDESALNIAVCGQEAFLPNVTIRECIIGCCEYKPQWFNIVITYCQLLEDLQRLPGGENYVIGSGGIALSGGQRQRVGIARAVYADLRAILLDDVFSALDSRTAVAILMGLCGPEGLLRERNCTVVLTGYLPKCLEVADNLVLLDSDGKASFEHRDSKGKLETEVACLLREGLLGQSGPPPEVPAATQASEAQPDSDLEFVVDERRKKGDKNLYLLWIDSVGRLAMVAFVLAMAIVAGSDAMPSVFIRLWIQLAPANKNYLIGYALIAVSVGLFTGAGLSLMFQKLAPRASNGLHGKLTRAMAQATIGFLSTTDSGSLLNRHSEDMELLSKKVPTKMYSTLYSLFGVLGHVGAVLAGTTYMVAVLPILIFCLFLIQWYYLRTARQLRLLQIEAQAPLVTALRDIGMGLPYIRAFGTAEHDFSRCLQLLHRSQKPYYYLLTLQAFLYLVIELLVAFMAVILSVLALYAHDTTSPNAAGLAFLNLINLGAGFNMVVDAWTSMETAVGSLARLRNFLRDTPTEYKGGSVDLPLNWPTRGEVIFDNVAARYKIDDSTEQPDVLESIQLHFEPGKKIGVMGRTGSGKSSLLYSILGFLEYEGRIAIDGVDVNTVHPDQLRSRVITISQDLVELDGTVRDNLLPYDKVWGETKQVELSPEQQKEAERRDKIVREALVRLGIWERLLHKGGLNAMLNKVGYSYGEKQLFCIARAVVRRRLTGSKLLLVDEATASVDSWRQQIVREMMLEYFPGCTIIIVAHREETIADSNRMVHMADGHVTRIDNYDN